MLSVTPFKKSPPKVYSTNLFIFMILIEMSSMGLWRSFLQANVS